MLFTVVMACVVYSHVLMGKACKKDESTVGVVTTIIYKPHQLMSVYKVHGKPSVISFSAQGPEWTRNQRWGLVLARGYGIAE
jgi:hypothetical protein